MSLTLWIYMGGGLLLAKQQIGKTSIVQRPVIGKLGFLTFYVFGVFSNNNKTTNNTNNNNNQQPTNKQANKQQPKQKQPYDPQPQN